MTLENCLKLFKLPLYVWHSELSALALGINKDSKRAEHNSIQCNSFCKEAVTRVFLILIPYYMILLGNFVPIHRQILQQWSSFAGRDVKVISKKQARNSFGFLDCGFCFAVSFLSAKSYNNIDFHSSGSCKLPNILYLYLQGVPKKIVILSGFEFLTLGGVFLGVKNNSKNFLFYKFFWFI